MGWRTQEHYDRAERERQRQFIASLSLRDRLRLRIWQAFGIGIVVCIFALLLLSMTSARSAPIDPSNVAIIDGDTIRVYHRRPDVRLVGFNTPETRRAQCKAEEALGAKATRRLRDLVRAGNLDFQFVPCACQPGTEGACACNFGRRCGILKAAGRDVGAILIADKLAVPLQCGTIRCPRTPRPWCE